jgi:adenylate cyclase
MADVFVSYARTDKARVAPLVAAIEAKGWTVWWDPEITPGQEFDRQIAAELERAVAVLVIWTPNSVESRWVRGEARDGADRGILVPVRLGNVPLPIDFRAFHTTDLDGTNQPGVGSRIPEVLRALGALIDRAGQSRSVTAATTPAPVAPTATPGPARDAICVQPFATQGADPAQHA